MVRRIGIFVLASMTLLLLAGLGLRFYLFSGGDASPKVINVAPSPDNYLLEVDDHIRFAPRPPETYPFPIPLGEVGPSQSLYSGPNQYPFYCMTLDSDLGQPEIDNYRGFGVPVYRDIEAMQTAIGYSKDCGVKAQLRYFKFNGNRFVRLSPDEIQSPANLDAPLFRVEHGSINRFIYTLAMPITAEEIGDRLAQSKWNRRLIYQFNGGAGIGYRQGRQRAHRVLGRVKQQMLDGYAVISSSGNRTSYTYNMLLAEDTARRVKHHFVSLYGAPMYTVGIGGSGGGLAQYLIAQNSQGILDGLIPLYSYPDMITTTTYALDCDLLNNYFTFRAKDRGVWDDWRRRQLLEGMNALNDFPQDIGFLQPVNQLMAGFAPSFPSGNSECINGYFGLSSLINNPRQGFLRDLFEDKVVTETKWSYWQDVSHIFGKDEHGYGLTTWDNVGVQYGLLALRQGHISIEEFLDVNRKIGSWKPQEQMMEETIWTPFGHRLPIWLSLWGNQNITESEHGVAPRREGSMEAMNAAYRWGQVFIGEVSLPILDVRHYLEGELDMHHISASFYSRLRMQAARGHADNHVIWMADKEHDPVTPAFKAMDAWLLKLKSNPGVTASEAKPQFITDTCFDADGAVLAQGDGVWDGEWNGQKVGACQNHFPMFSTSRIQAGGNWQSDIFKCDLMAIDEAVTSGVYRSIDVSAYLDELRAIFPQGVCDYRQKDLGRPHDI